MNLLLINPSAMPADDQRKCLNRTSILKVPIFSMPIGLIDLAAYVRKHVIDTKICLIDIGKDMYATFHSKTGPMTLEEFISLELDKVGFIPDVIGVSILFSSSHNSAKMIIGEAKKRWKGSLVVCGGNHASNTVDILLKDKNIDYVVRGEGELSFTEFLKQFQRGRRWMSVPGIASRQQPNTMLSPIITNLNKIPMPAYDLLDMKTYRDTIGASLMFSRGCYNNCTFCASHSVHGRKVRFKSNGRILDEIGLLHCSYGVRKLLIEDDLFAANKKKFLELVNRIYYKDITYLLPQGLSVMVLNEEIIDKMYDMGIREATVAIESGSPYTQKHLIKKNVDLTKAKRILDYLRKKDFYITVNFIFGLHGETKELMKESIEYMKTLDADWFDIFHAVPLPGSEMYNQMVSKGIIDPNTIDWDTFLLHGSRTFDTPEISAKELNDLVYDTNIECNFVHNSNIRHERYWKAITMFDRIILRFYPFHIVARYYRGLSYLKLGITEQAHDDFESCKRWIQKNEESKRLYERYGSNMEYLNETN